MAVQGSAPHRTCKARIPWTSTSRASTETPTTEPPQAVVERRARRSEVQERGDVMSPAIPPIGSRTSVLTSGAPRGAAAAWACRANQRRDDPR